MLLCCTLGFSSAKIVEMPLRITKKESSPILSLAEVPEVQEDGIITKSLRDYQDV